MSTILISTLTILALTTCFLAVLVWRLVLILTRTLDEERSEKRVLLGLSTPQPTMSTNSQSAISPEQEPDPLKDFEALSPEIQDTLLREYEEAMRMNPKNLTIHPEVEQILPGQTVSLPG